jgi:hypothetical protein
MKQRNEYRGLRLCEVYIRQTTPIWTHRKYQNHFKQNKKSNIDGCDKKNFQIQTPNKKGQLMGLSQNIKKQINMVIVIQA